MVPAARGEWRQAGAHVKAACQAIQDPEHLAGLVYTATARAQLAVARGDPAQVATALHPLLQHSAAGAGMPAVVPWQGLFVEGGCPGSRRT